jgi:hypothetical protein
LNALENQIENVPVCSFIHIFLSFNSSLAGR